MYQLSAVTINPFIGRMMGSGLLHSSTHSLLPISTHNSSSAQSLGQLKTFISHPSDYATLIPCSCGRLFKTEESLARHQADKNHAGKGRSCCSSLTGTTTSPPTTETSGNVTQDANTNVPSQPAKSKKKAWLWNRAPKPAELVHTILHSALVPSTTAVSSETGYQLVGSYNWQAEKPLTIQVPGHAAIWKDLRFPLTLPPDRGTHFRDINTARLPKHPFEPMLRAAASMNPHASFDDIDIIVNRSSLQKLLKFCTGWCPDDFRLSLHLVRNTLIIERCETQTREFARESSNPRWGRTFERFSTKLPTGLERSLAHHRTLRYSLGALNCAVQFEVDASYDPDGEKPTPSDAWASLEEEPSTLSAQPGKIESPPRRLRVDTGYPGARVMDQSSVAEIKTVTKNGNPNSFMTQLWFGRTPWLIVAQHKEGTFNGMTITDAAALFAWWEDRHQETLRKLATLLGELRAAVQKNRGRHSAAIFERGSGAIGIYDLMSDKQAVPTDLRRRLWT
ncbi:hypothetical protein LZ32DRAFT_603259 [Colletotrichum eremochloae]|nr:hypothetical protein LZ32DRAFT_603259 [Colletotrichum eremochloae]